MEKTGILFHFNPQTMPNAFDFAAIEKSLTEQGMIVQSISTEDEAKLHNAIAALFEKEQVGHVVISSSVATEKPYFNREKTKAYFAAQIPSVAHFIKWYPNTETAMKYVTQAAKQAATMASLLPIEETKQTTVNQNAVVYGGDYLAYKSAQALQSVGLTVLLLTPKMAATSGAPVCRETIEETKKLDGIEIMEDAELRRVEGAIGAFSLSVKLDGTWRRFETGVVVVTAGSDTQTNAFLPDESQPFWDFVAEAVGDNTKEKSAAILLDMNGHEPSGTATAAIRAALAYRKKGGKMHVLLQNAILRGHDMQAVYDEAREAGVRFFRFSPDAPPQIEKDSAGFVVTVRDTVFPTETIRLAVDSVTAPDALIPDTSNETLATRTKTKRDPEGYLQPANIRHWPVGSAREGLYFVSAGYADADPLDIRFDPMAMAAQASAALRKRSETPLYQNIHLDKQNCARCLTCYRLCPHGAIVAKPEQQSITILHEACQSCGVCASVCPGEALTYNPMPKAGMSQSIMKEDNQGKTLVFACRKSAMASLEEAARLALALPESVEILPVACAGQLDENLLIEAIGAGYEKVLVLGCLPEVCRSLHGNTLQMARIEKAKAVVEEMGLDAERLKFVPIANNEPHRIVTLLADFTGEKS